MQIRICFLLFTLAAIGSCKNNSRSSDQRNVVQDFPKELSPRVTVTDTTILIGDIYDTTSVQKFITGKKKTIIKGVKGLKVTVDPSVLEKEDGTAIDGKIITQIIEITDTKGLLKNNVSTVSNGRLLESGGSYFIDMKCKGQKVRIRKDRELVIDFPKISDDEMELFYGRRTSAGDMNWLRAGNKLTVQEAISFSNTAPFRPNNEVPFEGRVFRSLDSHVYLYENKITVRELVDSLNKNEKKIQFDTLYMWPKALPKNQVLDTGFLVSLYGPMYSYRIISCREYQEALDWKAAEAARLQKYSDEGGSRSLAEKLVDYYKPEGITQLGWINVDRFYNAPKTQIELDLPITLKNSTIEYFIVYKSFMGMMNGRTGRQDSTVIRNLPAGQDATLIAFSKQEGKIYHCKKDFSIAAFSKLKLDFQQISVVDLKRIFGSNVSGLN